MKTRGITNLGGTPLSVGDAVTYMTRGKYPRVGKGIIVQFRSKYKRVWDDAKNQWDHVEVWVPKIYSWSRWSSGYARWLLDCDLVFPINQTADEIQKELTT